MASREGTCWVHHEKAHTKLTRRPGDNLSQLYRNIWGRVAGVQKHGSRVKRTGSMGSGTGWVGKKLSCCRGDIDSKKQKNHDAAIILHTCSKALCTNVGRNEPG